MPSPHPRNRRADQQDEPEQLVRRQAAKDHAAQATCSGGARAPGNVAASVAATNPLDEFGPVHVVKIRKPRPCYHKRGSVQVRRAVYEKMARDGLTQAEAARQFGVSLNTVNRAARVYGLSFTTLAKRGGAGPRHPLYVECAAQGLSQSATAAALGVKRQSVAHFARRYGITFGWGGSGPRNGRPAAATACAPNHYTAEHHRPHALNHEEIST